MRNRPDSTGTQSASRALILLRHVGAANGDGVRLTDLVEMIDMDKSTIHRLLVCLMAEGFVERLPGTKRYRLGVEAIQLGLVASDMAPLIERFRPLMLKIARLSQDTVYLLARAGHYAQCVHRQDGPCTPPQASVRPGARRMLGLSAAGIGILAQASDAELDATYRRNLSLYQSAGASFNALRSLIDDTRDHGFSQMTSFGPVGTSGVGCAIEISNTTRVGISIAGINLRMSPARRFELGALLRSELQAFNPPS